MYLTTPFDACYRHQFRSYTYSSIDLKRLTTVYDSITLSAWQFTPLWILRVLRLLLQSEYMNIMPTMDGGGQLVGLQRCPPHEPLSRWRYPTRDMTLLHLHFLLLHISTISLLAVIQDGLGETILRVEILEKRESLSGQCRIFRRAGEKLWRRIGHWTGRTSGDERARLQPSGRRQIRAGDSISRDIRMKDTIVSQERDQVL